VEILKALNDHQLTVLADAVSLITYAPNDTIIKKGDVGNIFFMIKTGSVLCTELSGSAKSQKLGAGDYFGERSLMTDEPRAATVVAETACTVMALDRQDFEAILGDMKGLLESNLNLRILGSVPILSKLADAELQAVADLMHCESYKSGTKIIREGDPGKAFYIIQSGECLAKTGEKVLRKLHDGDVFGEMALLNDEPRVCDVIADGDVRVYELDKAAFNRILGSLKDIMKRTVSKRTKQNAKAAKLGNSSLRDIPKKDLKEVAFLGTGTFGRVSLVQDKKSGEVMALKAMSKAQIVAHRQQENVMNEKVRLGLCDLHV
jgi:CRP-like cAMP-binding protein